MNGTSSRSRYDLMETRPKSSYEHVSEVLTQGSGSEANHPSFLWFILSLLALLPKINGNNSQRLSERIIKKKQLVLLKLYRIKTHLHVLLVQLESPLPTIKADFFSHR